MQMSVQNLSAAGYWPKSHSQQIKSSMTAYQEEFELLGVSILQMHPQGPPAALNAPTQYLQLLHRCCTASAVARAALAAPRRAAATSEMAELPPQQCAPVCAPTKGFGI